MTGRDGAATAYEGGCLCGGVRYRFAGAPIVAGYCHCRLCRRAAGASVVALAVFPRAAFALARGATRTYDTSARGRRHFCPDCGTPLFFEPLDDPDRIEVMLGTLDDPNALRPGFHIWMSSAVPWLNLVDDLPRFPEGRPPGFGESGRAPPGP